MHSIVRDLESLGVQIPWATARDGAIPFSGRFGFLVGARLLRHQVSGPVTRSISR